MALLVLHNTWTPRVWVPGAVSARPTAAEAGHVHVVRAGETLLRIASRYGLTAAVLATANELTSPDRILVGMQLLIPGAVQARD